MEIENIQSLFKMIRIGGVVTGVFILIGAWVLASLVSRFLVGLGERLTERRLLLQQVAAFCRFGIYFVGIMLAAVSAVELRSETVLALSGTLGVAFGFAFKDLAASVIAGLTILVDRPFQVGDRVDVSGIYGDVVSIGLRSVRIVTLDDNLVTVPNSRFLNEAVASGNAGQLHMLVQMDFYVGPDQDLDTAVRLVEETVTTSRFCFLELPWVVLVSEVIQGEYFAVRLRAKAYVLDTKYEKAFENDVTRRLLRAFREEGIGPPARLHRDLSA